MAARRKPVRERDIVSFGRRTPRFNLLELREEVLETSKLAKIVAPGRFRQAKASLQAAPPASNEDSPFLFQ